MSGGRFDYVDSRLKGEIFGWSDRFSNVFEDREISELLWFVALPVPVYSFIVSNPRSSVEVRTPRSKEESDFWGQKKGACEGSRKVNVLQGAGCFPLQKLSLK